MAATQFSLTTTFVSPLLPSSKLSNLSHKLNQTRIKPLVVCLSHEPSHPSLNLNRRNLNVCFTSFTLSLLQKGLFSPATNASILEADDDIELLERVKKDRKKRIEKQGVINSSAKETEYLQNLVYKMSMVGQAIDGNDLSRASSVLGQTDWISNANIAFAKLSSSPQEKTEVDTFNTALTSLIKSVSNNDAESSKVAFVSSASALENWSVLTGLVDELKGL